ncbi:MAG: dethiobiotin synthase [Chitinophagales bacterium]|nr:dethiobiotin synthase [Chitinophagales bacterium]MCZ2392811.1 dethiobiotin synthase [Chitinophagales bacterium]
MKPHKIAIVGIGTEVGKTLASAIVCTAINAIYWKPIQSGYLNGKGDRDSSCIAKWTDKHILPEIFLLQEPLSPHIAAKIDQVEITIPQLKLPDNIQQNLIIETAGGIMVPLNDTQLFIDLIQYWNIPVILIVRQYLGNINHTLLSIEALKRRNIPIIGFIANGEELPDTNNWIQQYTQLPLLLQIPELQEITIEDIQSLASELKINLKKYGVE